MIIQADIIEKLQNIINEITLSNYNITPSTQKRFESLPKNQEINDIINSIQNLKNDSSIITKIIHKINHLSRNLLYSDIQFMKGVGPKLSKFFKKININTIYDFIHTPPRLYLDRRNITKINTIKDYNNILIEIQIKRIIVKRIRRRNFHVFEVIGSDNTGFCYLTFFNQKYLLSKLNENDYLIISGKGKKTFDGIKMTNFEYEIVEDVSDNNKLNYYRIVPIYHLTQGLTQKYYRKLINRAICMYGNIIPEFFPIQFLKAKKLIQLKEAYKTIHFPDNSDNLDFLLEKNNGGYFRLKYNELFFIQFYLKYKKKIIKETRLGHIIKSDNRVISKFLKLLPFKLTKAQINTLKEIRRDMQENKPMNRLIQGDVGSGKTIVAFIAMLMCFENGSQAIIMAPTEIIAKQHYNRLKKYCDLLNICTALLIGNTKKKEKSEIIQKVKTGKINFLFGTHSIIQKDVEFDNPGLIITDEQHRFGVEQRSILYNKAVKQNVYPNVLVLTATPIPRTMTLTIYGDLDISIIDKMPFPKKIKTEWYTDTKTTRKRIFDIIKYTINKKQKTFIIYPVIEDSKIKSLRPVTQMYEEFCDFFGQEKVGLLHGRLKSDIQNETLNKFVNGAVDILVTTSIIEVGVDIPNATLMIIENAERFGLAQLHQMRGRIGRTGLESNCLLITSNRNDLVKQRMQCMVKYTDGFKIAEEDFQLRGPGEFAGVRQHGLSDLKYINIFSDTGVVRKVTYDVEEIFKNNSLEEIKYKFNEVFTEIKNKFPQLDLINIG